MKKEKKIKGLDNQTPSLKVFIPFTSRTLSIITNVNSVLKQNMKGVTPMAISYTRSYDHILDDLSRALATVPHFYESFEMEAGDWENLSKDEQDICIRTLADDLFYVLGSESTADVGLGNAEYDSARSIIKVTSNAQLVHVVSLRE
jgi:hypothetical protein